MSPTANTAAGEPIPFDAETIPDSLRPYLAEDSEPEPPGPPTLNFQPGRIYDVNPEGAIITRAGRRQAAQLAGEASWQAACEVEAARPLDPETEAALAAEHDLRIGAQLKAAEPPARGRPRPTR